MMNQADGWLKSAIKRWLTYLIGLIIIVIIIFIGGYFIARPYIDNFVNAEVKKHGIQADSAHSQLSGRIHMVNVHVPTPTGIALTIGELTARPPLGIVSGAATLYNVDLIRDNIHVHIPEISINGIKTADKDPSETSHVLQILNRASVSSIYAAQVEITDRKANGETEKTTIKGFRLSSYNKGAIGTLSLDSLDGNLTLNTANNDGASTLHITAKSDGLSANNIDLGYGYRVFSGRAQNYDQGKTLFGNLNFKNVAIDVLKGPESLVHLKLGSLDSDGLALKAQKQIPEDLLKSALLAKKSGLEDEAKENIRALLVATLGSISALDANIANAELATPKLKTSFASFKFQPQNWTSLIPEDLLVSIAGLKLDTTQFDGKKAEFFHNLGYDTLNLNGQLEFEYQSTNQALLLKTLEFDANNIARAKLSAKLIHVDEQVFDGNPAMLKEVLNKFGLISFEMQYSDYGLIDHLMNAFSIIAGAEKKDVYMVFDTMLADMPRLLSNDVQKQQAFATELNKFAKKPETIVIKGQAKNSEGITQADIDTNSVDSAADLIQKLNLEIKTSAN